MQALLGDQHQHHGHHHHYGDHADADADGNAAADAGQSCQLAGLQADDVDRASLSLQRPERMLAWHAHIASSVRHYLQWRFYASRAPPVPVYS